MVIILNNVIRKLRKKRKLTQSELAIRCNVSQAYISQLEHYEVIPSVPMILELSKWLKVCPDEILVHFLCPNCPYSKFCKHDCFKAPTYKALE